jgi:hypothetical protein
MDSLTVASLTVASLPIISFIFGTIIFLILVHFTSDKYTRNTRLGFVHIINNE